MPTLATLERLLQACGRELTLSSRPMSELDPIDQVRRHAPALHRAAARRGARNIRVFGSVARGDSSPASDVDLLVDLDESHTLLDLAGFAEDATEILGRPVDVATVGMLKERIRDRVLEQAVPL